MDVQPFMTAGLVSNGVLVETEGRFRHKLVVNRRDDVVEYMKFKAGYRAYEAVACLLAAPGLMAALIGAGVVLAVYYALLGRSGKMRK